MSKPVLSIGKNRQNDEIETSLPEVGSLSLIHSYVYIYICIDIIIQKQYIYIYIFKYPPDVEFISHIYIYNHIYIYILWIMYCYGIPPFKFIHSLNHPNIPEAAKRQGGQGI